MLISGLELETCIGPLSSGDVHLRREIREAVPTLPNEIGDIAAELGRHGYRVEYRGRSPPQNYLQTHSIFVRPKSYSALRENGDQVKGRAVSVYITGDHSCRVQEAVPLGGIPRVSY